jgi:hypothetical protein
MTLIELKIKIPEYAKEELDRLIKKYSDETLKGEYDFDKNTMITLMIMTYDKTNSIVYNPEKVIKEIRKDLKDYYKK